MRTDIKTLLPITRSFDSLCTTNSRNGNLVVNVLVYYSNGPWVQSQLC
jgi:hypothetical protein